MINVTLKSWLRRKGRRNPAELLRTRFCRVDTVSSDIFDHTVFPPTSIGLSAYLRLRCVPLHMSRVSTPKFVRCVSVTWPQNSDAVIIGFKFIPASLQTLASVFINFLSIQRHFLNFTVIASNKGANKGAVVKYKFEDDRGLFQGSTKSQSPPV
jgi:hypothetical protein